MNTPIVCKAGPKRARYYILSKTKVNLYMMLSSKTMPPRLSDKYTTFRKCHQAPDLNSTCGPPDNVNEYRIVLIDFVGLLSNKEINGLNFYSLLSQPSYII